MTPFDHTPVTGPESEFLGRLRNLVARDEPELAVEQLVPHLRGLGLADAHREVLVHSGRLHRLRKEVRKGLLTRDQAAVERARIGHALLELLDELEARTAPAERPFPTPTVPFEPPADGGLEKIIGANHLKSIAWLERGLQAARAVCRIVTPHGLGTGFLVGNDRLLTNYHVLPDAERAARSHAEFNFQEDLRGHLLEVSRYPLLRDDFKADAELDYALVRVGSYPASPPLDGWGSLPLHGGPVPEIGEHVSIIQHPGGGPKQIAAAANQVVNRYEHRLQYTTDTLPGSSGSPVFNDDWKVVALHRAGGNLLINARGDRMFANEGIVVEAILERSGGCLS